MEPNVIALITFYLTCSVAAEERILTQSEVTSCASAYTAVKLSFIPDITPDTFAALPVEQRVAINNDAYAAWVAWQAANPDTITNMRNNAHDNMQQAIADF
ncbi:hypothetical protein [Thalassobius sp. I31.1]|uniref:hypothetical protein n=1 Tax=Thalassobius sp. I31.1 TaxID=2109912 RepID=UPI000D1A932F|nr:hypothetical protein [Thalassobius sp. I31.1]